MKLLRMLMIFILGSFVLLGCSRDPGVGPTDPGLGPNVQLMVKVVDAMTSAPIPSVRVTLKRDSNNAAPDQGTDGTGQTVFTVPAADGYKAYANNVPGYSPGASASIKLVGNTEVIIPLTAGMNGAGLVAGSVKDSRTQAPMTGVTVSLGQMGISPIMGQGQVGAMRVPNRAPYPQYPQPYPPVYRIQQVGGTTLQTDASGQFTFNNVPPGTYQVIYQFAGYRQTVKDNITVTQGQSTTIDTVFMSSETSQGAAGHVLIAESGRVYQLDQQGRMVWRYISGRISCATRLATGETLVADEISNQVSMVSNEGKVVWSLGTLGFNSVKAPGWVDAARDGKSFLVADTGNNRILEIENGRVVWQFTTGLNRPRAATYTPSGNILVADSGNKRVIEITRDGQVLWSFLKEMHTPVHAMRTDDGNTVITDAGYNRVIIINQAGQSVWFFDGSSSNPSDTVATLSRPRSVSMSSAGNFLIVDTGNNRVLEVSRQKQVMNVIQNLVQPQAIERL